MFGFFKNRREREREGLRSDFHRVLGKVSQAPEVAQVAVGYGINFATKMLQAQFGSLPAFQKLPEDQKLEYLKSCIKAEEAMQAKDPTVSVGFSLFKMLVGTLAANDEELFYEFSKALAPLSKKGDLL